MRYHTPRLRRTWDQEPRPTRQLTDDWFYFLLVLWAVVCVIIFTAPGHDREQIYGSYTYAGSQ